MAEGFYEVDVKTLWVVQLYKDGNKVKRTHENHNDTEVKPQNAALSYAIAVSSDE